MEHRRLGRTGLSVSILGFGGAEIGFEQADADTASTLLNAALDGGCTVIDTAACYRDSESLIGAAIAHRRSEYALFTKCGHASGLPMGDWDAAVVAASCERSLRRLRTDVIDLLQLHSCPLTVLQDGRVLAELERMRDQGKVRFIGYSGDGEAARWAAASGRFDCIQLSLSIADQEAIDLILPVARAHDLGVIAKRPIANAAWRHGGRPPEAYHQPYWERLEALAYPFLQSATVDEGVRVALGFTVAQDGVHTAIVGTANPQRFAGNATMLARGPLPASTLAAIRQRWSEVAPPSWGGQM